MKFRQMFLLIDHIWHMKWIELKANNLRTCKINKTCLPCYDDQKDILEDGYSVLSRFHESIC